MEFLFILTLLIIGYSTGQFFEISHYKKIRSREKKLNHIPIITSRWQDVIEDDEAGLLCEGLVVISSDYFKTFVSGIRSIFGGRLREYESLLDRGRREAILRMKEKAVRWGAEKIVNLRLEHSSVHGNDINGGYLPIVEVLAYATAVKKQVKKQKT